MAWDLRKTYYYLVCFAALIMLVIGTVSAVRAILDLAMPDDVYRPTAMEYRMRFDRPGQADESPYTQEELEKMANEEAERNRRSAQRRAIRNLIGNLALILIAAPLYGYHWRQVRRLE